MKQHLNEVKRLQKIAGILNENFDTNKAAINVDKLSIWEILRHLVQGRTIETKVSEKIGQLYIRAADKSNGEKEYTIDTDKLKQDIDKLQLEPEQKEEVKDRVDKLKNVPLAVDNSRDGTYFISKLK